MITIDTDRITVDTETVTADGWYQAGIFQCQVTLRPVLAATVSVAASLEARVRINGATP